jgi:hypothetical protein
MTARLLLAAGLAGFGLSATPAADKPEDQAREAAVAFAKAMRAKDAEAATKLADVPFLHLDDPRRKPAPIAKTDDLRAELKTVVDRLADPGRIPTDVLEVVPGDKVAARYGRKDNKEVTEQIERFLGKAGFLVILDRGGGKPGGGVLVTVKDGKAKVVGIVDE